LHRSIKAIKNQVTPALLKALQLGKHETLIDIDGTATTQPVLQHVGVSTWPGILEILITTLASDVNSFVTRMCICMINSYFSAA